MGFFDEVLILLALIFFFSVGECGRGVGLLYQRVPDVLFIAQNILDTANLPEGGILLGRDTYSLRWKAKKISADLQNYTKKIMCVLSRRRSVF